jgi:predicted glycoside hydrolase/deacetylase ChbG (UPF0249 family)
MQRLRRSALLLAIASPLAAQSRNVAERLGLPRDAKLLIIHADDLAVAHSVNVASFDALNSGAVSSASIMVPTPWLTEVAAYAKSHPSADLGLHLTVTAEWETYRWGSIAPSDKVRSLLDSAGVFPNSEQKVGAKATAADVERELRAQVDRAIAVGIQPTHLDTHMGALFARPDITVAYARVAHDYKLPFLAPRGAPGTAQPPFTDKDILLDAIVAADPNVPRAQWKAFYLKLLADLKPGLTEMIVHLGHDDAELQAVMVDHEPYGSAWRQRDYEVVTSPEFKQALADNHITVVTWRQLKALVQ